MKMIGRGAQYVVLEVNEGRVRKIPHTLQQSQAVVASWSLPKKVKCRLVTIDYPLLAQNGCHIVQSLLRKYPQLAATFGAPIFEKKGHYTQQKVETFGCALRRVPLEEGEALIDAFVELTKQHWEYGLCEYVFNCTVNNGINQDGEVVLLDFGEITTNRQKAREKIAAAKWRDAFSYRHDIPVHFKAYYCHKMESELSLQTFDELWGQKRKKVRVTQRVKHIAQYGVRLRFRWP